MQAILNLQRLEAPVSDASFFGSSTTSSQSGCCNDNQQIE